jgi:hypothetical protein
MGADSKSCLSFSRCADLSFISWPFCGLKPPGKGTGTSLGGEPVELLEAVVFWCLVLSALDRDRLRAVVLDFSAFELRLDSTRPLLVVFLTSRLVAIRPQSLFPGARAPVESMNIKTSNYLRQANVKVTSAFECNDVDCCDFTLPGTGFPFPNPG